MKLEDKFNHNTKIISVIGHPIKHSLSPLMHNISFEINGLNYIYLPFDVPSQNLKAAIRGMVALNIKGINVTLPHKEKIFQFINEMSEEAGVIGAVNTVVNDNGTLFGYNTDVNGVIETLNPYKDEINGANVSVIGAGGAARSVIYALMRYFKVEQINILNRTEQTADSLKSYFVPKMHFDAIRTYELVPPDVVGILSNSKLVINTTPLGMAPDTDDAATTIAESFNKDQIVFDLIYNPLKTKFLAVAESQGARIVNGLRMFVEQGARSFELWTGEKMPVDKIYKTLQNYLSQ